MSTWSRDYVLVVLVIRNLCNQRFSTLKRHLQNQYNKGVDEYPTTIDYAFRILQNYILPKVHQPIVRVIKKKTTPSETADIEVSLA